jgi:hypothetical protein
VTIGVFVLLAAGFLFAVDRQWLAWPPWQTYVGVAIGVLMAALLFVAYRWNSEPQLAKEAVLELTTFEQNQQPNAAEEINIARWFYMDARYEVVKRSTGEKTSQYLSTFLFIIFDRPIANPRAEVTSKGMQLPPNEFKTLNERGAVILFNGKLAAGAVRIRVPSLNAR